MSELLVYIIIGIVWLIASLITKANKQNNKKRINTNKTRNNNTSTYTSKNRKADDEEEIFRELQKNIRNLKNYNEEVLRENTKKEEVYTSNYETSNYDREILELQEKYNSKITQINNIKNDSNYSDINNLDNKSESEIYINSILSSLDIKKAIIYNAILEPKRINYRRLKNRT